MALPVPARLSSFDRGRDGASLSASFFDGDGALFTLTLPIRTDGATFAACAYGPPDLERCVPHLYTDKFTGGQHGYETRETVTLAWEDGEVLLAQLAPLPAERPGGDDAALLAGMRQVIAARGVLP